MSTTYERPRARAIGLRPWADRATRGLIEAMYAREGDAGELAPPPSERVEWVRAEIDDFLARVSTRSYAIVLLSLLAVSLLAPLFVRRIGALASLALRERVHALERLEKSMLAPALLAVKALLSVHYYEHPDAAREVGFDGACMSEVK
jgi:hypothetical protein